MVTGQHVSSFYAALFILIVDSIISSLYFILILVSQFQDNFYNL
jgi:hypothetical protein